MGLNLLDIVIWWLALEIIGLAALPVASYVCRDLKDNGYSLSKPLGLLLFTYLSWLISLFAGYSYFSILFSLGIMAVLSLVISFRNGLAVDRDYAFRFEFLFFLAFAGFAIIRAYSPDIYWTGGEKLMDMTFINSLLRTSEFPPHDPWMSGTILQYYYFGYLIVADLIKITGVLPSIAFNLATASFFALSLTSAFGAGYNLTQKIRYGIITAFFVTVAGNLAGAFQLMASRGGGVINNILSFDYWTSSRVIPDTINEFPYFSFLQGDVHAHMISITFQLLIVLLLLDMFRSRALNKPLLFVLGLSIGFLYPLNTWDYPVYLFLAVFVMTVHFYLKESRGIHLVAAISSTAALSYLLYLPYHISYKVERVISFVPSGRTSLMFYLAIYGLFIYLLYTFVMSKNRKYSRELSMIASLAVAVISIIELKLFIVDKAANPEISGFELMVLLVPLLVLSAISMIRENDENHVFVLILIMTGALISLFCELFYVQDALGKANPALIRMNTIFKLYLQNWVLWGIAAGAAVFRFRERLNRRNLWGAAALVLILMASVYPVFGTLGKSDGFRGEPNLDGAAYIKREHPQEYAAVLWFRNISGQPVVLQAGGEPYKWNTYITAFTGLPTVIGWAGHEMNWRSNSSEVNMRWQDVHTMYTSSDMKDVSGLLDKYNVTYVYFGEAEQKKKYSPLLFDAHPERFEKAFEYGDVVVYKVKR